MDEIKFYVVDVETTGLQCGHHEVTQISIIRCSDRNQLNKYIKAEFPDRAQDRALKITGRTREDILNGESRKDVVEACNKFFEEDGGSPEGRCIVGHNIQRFDRRFLHELWESVGKEFPAFLWLDTLPSTKAFAVKKGIVSPTFNLEASLNLTGTKHRRKNLHNAVVDTQNTYMLWKKLDEEGVDMLEYTERVPHRLE